jgi:hypothetical protein
MGHPLHFKKNLRIGHSGMVHVKTKKQGEISGISGDISGFQL